MRSIGDVLDHDRGLGKGFDGLRILLATLVVVWHSINISGSASTARQDLWLFAFGVLPMFFALSGFLITASARRLSLRDFLTNRALRILPALAVEIVLSGLILGPLFTSMSLRDYFGDPALYKYGLNVVGLIHYELPGVFTDAPYPSIVNGSLWTIPLEIGCYVVMTGLIVSRAIRKVRSVVATLAAVMMAMLAFHISPDVAALPTPVPLLAKIFLSPPGLLAFFLSGSMVYLLRHRLPFDTRLIVTGAAICALVCFIGDRTWETSPVFLAASVLLVPYLTVLVGLSDIPTPGLLRRSDYSYGIYLYAFPIQQAVVTLAPGSRNALFNFVVSFPLILMFACFSWHAVERPLLRLRRRPGLVTRATHVEQASNA